jgi:hypothetical protein
MEEDIVFHMTPAPGEAERMATAPDLAGVEGDGEAGSPPEKPPKLPTPV